MGVQALNGVNTGISNISWYRGALSKPVEQTTHQPNFSVSGNPNRPVVLNSDPYAGPIVTFDRLG